MKETSFLSSSPGCAVGRQLGARIAGCAKRFFSFRVFPLLAAAVSLSLGVASAASVTDYGAVGDGVTDDTAAFAAAIAAGGTINVPLQSGACYAINGSTGFAGVNVGLMLPAGVTLQGQNHPTLCSNNSNNYFILGNQDGNIKIDGITFQGTDALIVAADPNTHHVSNVTFTNNAVQHIPVTVGGAGVATWGLLMNSNISYNLFWDIWQGGYAQNGTNMSVLFPNDGPGGTPCYNSTDGYLCDTGESGLSMGGGAVNTIVSHNVFRQVQSDAFFINVRPEQLSDATHVDSGTVEVSWNEFDQIHRIGIEIGGFNDCYGTNGACDFSLPPFSGLTIKNNWFHDPAMSYWHTFGYSIVPNGALNTQFINNAAIMDNLTDCYGNATADAVEIASNTMNYQGNVNASAYNACGQHGWGGGYTILGGLNTQIATQTPAPIFQNNVNCGTGGTAGNGFGEESGSRPWTVQYNFAAETCPQGAGTAVGTSNIALSFTSPDGQADSGSSVTFSNAIVSTLPIGHVQWFVDGSTTPIATQELSNVNNNFATTLQWLYSTVLNTSALTNGTHKVTAVATDVSNATQSVTQSFVVTGGVTGNGNTGPTNPTSPTQPVPANSPLPSNLPSGMILWLANDTGVVTSGSSVSAWDDQSGHGNNAVQSQAANQPTIVNGNNGEKALHFNGSSGYLSVPSLSINGLTGMTVFAVSANAVNNPNAAANSALLFWPESANWGNTYFGPFQTTSHFRFGTTQSSNDSLYTFSFTRTNSFGLSEWEHSGSTDSLYFNGKSVANYSGKLSTLAGVSNTLTIGQGISNSYFTGDVSEIIIYQRALSAAERSVVEKYLMGKYHL